MKILVHDYSGHPFQAQLSRELARRGHLVHHVHCRSYISGKGRVDHEPGDPASLLFVALEVGELFAKYSPRRRFVQERSYARKFVAYALEEPPDLVVTCNVPLVAHALIKRRLIAHGIRTVFWHQDVYSWAIGLEARRRLGPLGSFIGLLADRTEAWIARNASAVIAISDHFLSVHRRWGTDPAKLHVIENWGPLDEITPRPRDNPWAIEHGLVDGSVMLYSGTLGLKHDTQRLIDLLRAVRVHDAGAQLVVISAGPAADRLKISGEPGLQVLPFQPFDRLAEVLASADLLVTILEHDASKYSVPSKALTYLCAGRPVLALVPASNPVSTIVSECGGLAIDPATTTMAATAAEVARLLADQGAVERRGNRARAYAEKNFDIRRIADRFEGAFLHAALEQPASSVPAQAGAAELDESEVGGG